MVGGRGEGRGEGREGGRVQMTGGHWPFSVHFSKLADHNQIIYKWPMRYEEMANQFVCTLGVRGEGRQ